MGYSSRRPHRVPLLSAKNRKRRRQFAQAHQNRTVEDWKNVAWSNESRFLLRHSDGRVRMWRKEHESMDPFTFMHLQTLLSKATYSAFRLYIFVSVYVPWELNPQPFVLLTQCSTTEPQDPSCLVSTVQAGGGGGVMVWVIFSQHTLGPLVPIEHRLKATARVLLLTMSIPLWLQCIHLLMATSSRIMHHLTKFKSFQTGFLYMTMYKVVLKAKVGPTRYFT